MRQFLNQSICVQLKPRLAESPGVRYLDYRPGDSKGGWWDWGTFAVQLEDLLDCFELLCPEMQLQIEIGWSSGHAKYTA